MGLTPRVLIVDDSLTVRMDLGEAFSESGFMAVACESLQAAREALASGAFDLMLLDVMLPDGDGIDFLREMRSSSRGVPVLLLSCEAAVKDRVRGLMTGADDFVGKPYDRSHVIARARQLASASQPAPAGPCVLVIDDSPLFLEALRRALSAEGYSVSTASTGEEGLSLAAHLRPDAVIVDGHLPGMDGAAVLRRIRSDAALRKTHCLLLTAFDDPGAELKALEAGADAFILKGDDGGVGVILARLAAFAGALRGTRTQAPKSLLGPKRVLAVDDDPDFRKALCARLRGEGYDAVEAADGREALELLAVQEVDAVLLDLGMPGPSGYETCSRLKGASGRGREVPVLILSRQEGPQPLIEAISAGADDFVSKSSGLEVVSARLKAQLRRRQFEEENRQALEQKIQARLAEAEAGSARRLADAQAAFLAELQAKNRELERRGAELAASNRELEAFSFSVSHDLRAPLRAIDGFSYFILEKHAENLGEEGRELFGFIRDNAKRMNRLIEDLLRFSRLGRQSMSPTRVDMAALAGSVWEELKADLGPRRVEFRLGPLPDAWGDAPLLRQVFANLLSNAVKYTGRKEAPVVEVGGRRGEGESVWFVKDNGAGFDMKSAHRLFGVFQRLHRAKDFEGTGIGLALVQRIVNRHGGRVWAEAEPEAGATFHFALPEAARPGGEQG
jgi:DNA-binding response OmpR family regulator